MGKLVDGADGLRAEEVGVWVDEKLFDVREYVRLSHGARRKFLGSDRSGASYIDLFCGAGQSRIRETGTYVDGTAVAAWKMSRKQGSPFSQVYIADTDTERRILCAKRLRALGAPVFELEGTALEGARSLITRLNTGGLHFAFVDPYNLGSLNFNVLKALAAHPRMDILVHISAMDLTRNIESQSSDESEFDAFAPGWRKVISVNLPRAERCNRVVKYWASLVQDELAMNSHSEMHPVRNSKNALVYWLLLLYRHELAGKFWDIVINHRPQTTVEMF